MKKAHLLYFLIFICSITTTTAQYSEDEWAERDKWMNVSQILDWAGVEVGQTVADIGCHEGYLSIHLAKNVGAVGKVYAVDIKEYRLSSLKENAKKRNLTNIITVHGDYDDPKLPDNTFDVVFIVDTYHEMEDYMTILGHVRKSLNPGGRLVVLEKLKDHAKNKSRKEQVRSHTLSPNYVEKELKEAGFNITKEYRDIGDWENDSSKKIWVMVAELPES